MEAWSQQHSTPVRKEYLRQIDDGDCQPRDCDRLAAVAPANEFSHFSGDDHTFINYGLGPFRVPDIVLSTGEILVSKADTDSGSGTDILVCVRERV